MAGRLGDLRSTYPVAEHSYEICGASADTMISSLIERQDWAFLDGSGRGEIDALHPYPAKFIPEIPGTLIDLIQPPSGTLILDPFAGSGTTLVEAQRRGYESVGIDLNPVACLISRVRTGPTPSDLVEVAQRTILEARAIDQPAIPAIPNIDHWFRKDIQLAAAALRAAIETRVDHECYDALRLALSSILVRVSNQDSDTRYAAVEKNISAELVFRQFEISVEKIERALRARDWKLTRSNVIERNIFDVTPADIRLPVGLVVTSPPYPNAYEYWLYHKYRMWWLGFDPISVKKSEIGARAHFFKTRRHTAGTFRDQMLDVMKLLSTVVTPGGSVCFVVGRSKIHGEIVDNAETIREVGEQVGFRFETRIERVIPKHKKSFNLSHANIKTESIVVLRK